MSSLSHKLVRVSCILSTVHLGKPSSHSRKAELIWMEWLSIFISFLNTATQSEQYNDSHEITWVTAKMMEKHFETWWLELQMIFVKVMKLWKNVSDYFLKKVPTLSCFSVGESFLSGYACIKDYLQNKNIPAVISFSVLFAQDFEKNN